jgi:hypothetical protein
MVRRMHLPGRLPDIGAGQQERASSPSLPWGLRDFRIWIGQSLLCDPTCFRNGEPCHTPLHSLAT